MFVCVKHIGFTMSDVMSMRTSTRRHQLTLLTNEQTAKREHIEGQQEKQSMSGKKGERQSKVGGDMLKAELLNPNSKLGNMIRGQN